MIIYNVTIKVQEAIKEGRIRVTPGKGRAPFTLSALCSTP